MTIQALYQWLKQYKRDKTSKEKVSHTLRDAKLVGFGSVILPDDKLEEFYDRYELEKDSVYLIEFPKTTFKLYFDFDMLFELNNASTLQDLDPMFVEIQKCINAAFTETNQKTMYIGSAGVSDKQKDGVTYSKLGLHIFWPDLYVDKETLCAVRNYLVEQLSPIQNLKNPWSDVIDIQVCKSPSCRMFGSAKLENCPCKGKCYHKGKMVDVGRIYKLKMTYTPNFKIQYQDLPLSKVLKLASLREELPASKCELEEYKEKSKKRTKDAPNEDEELAVKNIIKFLCSKTDGENISSITKGKKSFTVEINVRFCYNKYFVDGDGIHGSNKSYIEINKDGFLYRYCRCCCEVQRRFSTCGQYVERIMVPNRVYKILFKKEKPNWKKKIEVETYCLKNDTSELVTNMYKLYIK